MSSRTPTPPKGAPSQHRAPGTTSTPPPVRPPCSAKIVSRSHSNGNEPPPLHTQQLPICTELLNTPVPPKAQRAPSSTLPSEQRTLDISSYPHPERQPFHLTSWNPPPEPSHPAIAAQVKPAANHARILSIACWYSQVCIRKSPLLYSVPVQHYRLKAVNSHTR